MISEAWRRWRTPLTLGVALACSAYAEAALAQFYFRPFAYTYRYDLPPEDDDYEAPRFSSRRAVSRILAREGFQLVGPLGRRGDQIVATGVSRREGETRFFIDPYEGAILHAVTIGPPPATQPRDDGFVPQLGGSHPVVKDMGRDRAPPEARPQERAQERLTERPRRSVARAPDREAPISSRPERPAVAPTPQAPVAAPAPNAKPPRARPVEAAKPQPAAPPVEAAKPIEWAKPAEIAGKPPEPAKPAETPKAVEAPKPVEPAAKPVAAKTEPPPPRPAETAKAVAPTSAKESGKPASGSAKAPAAKATAARSTGGGSYRAIVPPKAAEGTTVVTPSTPATATAHSPAGPRTPQSAAAPAKKD